MGVHLWFCDWFPLLIFLLFLSFDNSQFVIYVLIMTFVSFWIFYFPQIVFWPFPKLIVFQLCDIFPQIVFWPFFILIIFQLCDIFPNIVFEYLIFSEIWIILNLEWYSKSWNFRDERIFKLLFWLLLILNQL